MTEITQKIMKKSRKSGWTIGNFFKYTILLIGAIAAVLPLLVVLIGSFKSNEEFLTSGVLALPQQLDFSNYVTAFVNGQMLTGFKNTFFIFIVSMVGKLTLGSMFAYAMNRFDFRYKKLILTLFMTAMLIPGITSQVATFQIIESMGLFNTIWSVIVLNLGTDVISIYIFIQYMENIPVSLDESAIIDGASYWKIYWKIMLPLLKPAIVTACILKGVGVYNEYYSANLYLTKENLKTMAISLYTFTGPLGSQYNLICAGVIISLLPALIVFIVFQKQIYSGITAGAVKG